MKLGTDINPLKWDSDFFGFLTAKVDIRNSSEDAELLQRGCEQQGVHLLYIYAYDDEGIAFAQRMGARRIEERITLTMKIFPSAPLLDADGHFATSADRNDLLVLAWQSAEQSRFKRDPKLPVDSWREMYRIWLDKSLDGEMADAILIERDEKGVAGMITVSAQNAVGKIGLFAVDKRARGRGLGRRLLDRASAWFAAQGCQEANVVTQGDNDKALKTYRNSGYTIKEAVVVFHWWGD